MAVGVYATDVQGRIRRYNAAMVELWGRRPSLGKKAEWLCGSVGLYRLDGTPLPKEQSPMAEVVRTGQPMQDEMIIERPDGSCATVAVYPAPIRDRNGCMIGAINCVIDITARKAAEDTAVREHAEASRRAEQLQRLTAELTQAEQRERHRLAQILHDHLQQLLVGVKFQTGLLQQKVTDEQTLESLRYLTELADESIQASRTLTREAQPAVAV